MFASIRALRAQLGRFFGRPSPLAAKLGPPALPHSLPGSLAERSSGGARNLSTAPPEKIPAASLMVLPIAAAAMVLKLKYTQSVASMKSPKRIISALSRNPNLGKRRRVRFGRRALQSSDFEADVSDPGSS